MNKKLCSEMLKRDKAKGARTWSPALCTWCRGNKKEGCKNKQGSNG